MRSTIVGRGGGVNIESGRCYCATCLMIFLPGKVIDCRAKSLSHVPRISQLHRVIKFIYIRVIVIYHGPSHILIRFLVENTRAQLFAIRYSRIEVSENVYIGALVPDKFPCKTASFAGLFVGGKISRARLRFVRKSIFSGEG